MPVYKSELVSIREGIKEDNNFILSTWLKGLRYGNSWFGLIDKDAYFKVYGDLLNRVLSTPGCKVSVACLKDNPDCILGYSVTRMDGLVLDFVYSKRAWRNIGIAKSLIPENVKFVTSITTVGAAMLKKRSGVTFNPFI